MLCAIPMDKVGAQPQVGPDGAYLRLAPDMKEYPLRVVDGKASASLVVKGNENDAKASYYVQVRTTSTGRAPRWFEWSPMVVDITAGGKTSTVVAFGQARHKEKEAAKGKDGAKPDDGKPADGAKPAPGTGTAPKEDGDQ
jgi:hypothetical protein